MMPSFLPFLLFHLINQSILSTNCHQLGFQQDGALFSAACQSLPLRFLSFAAVQKTIKFKLSSEQVTRALELAKAASKSKFVQAGFVASSRHLVQFHHLCNYIIENGDSIDYGELLKLLARFLAFIVYPTSKC